MEHPHQPQGGHEEITDHDQPVVYSRSSTDTAPPVTFAEAERHNPFALLTELHNHALGLNVEHQRPTDAHHHLAELALSAAVVFWWSRWQPIAMHRAFQNGATLAEVAGAAGLTETETFGRWQAWAAAQAQLVLNGQPAVDPHEINDIRRRISTSDGTGDSGVG